VSPVQSARVLEPDRVCLLLSHDEHGGEPIQEREVADEDDPAARSGRTQGDLRRVATASRGVRPS